MTNELIPTEALSPYPEDLRIVDEGGCPALTSRAAGRHARSPQELVEQVHDNLRHLGVDGATS